ncbi:hypothetical protein GKZ28_05395 [Clostridium chromiireducens]|uniref:Uncharacterized protein n=1 Tax=Clostridium chromiireducens TaxID=225345 RepID=A0A964RK03_9CLOT|nr:hypothetical protein [Clostridium chromiireducens]MVX63132.1 hypothetical protein [Clostridium chromiireducens]
MKIKYSWIISFCLVAFIVLSFNVCANASTTDPFNYERTVKSYIDKAIIKNSKVTVLSSYTNEAVFYSSYASGSSTTMYIGLYLCSNSNLSIVTSSSSGGYSMTAPGSTYYLFYYEIDNNTGELFNQYATYCLTGSGGTTISSISTASGFLVKGTATINTKVAPDISDVTLPPRLADSDILNYNWDGNGLKIYNLTKGMNLSGYVSDDNIKYFDIETYGKFTYTGSDTFFTSIAYKQMQTSIQLASTVTYGSMTRRAGEGLGIKSFQWVSDTSHLKKGDVIKFRIVYQVPMLDKGTYDVKIGTTINDGSSNSYISDSVSSVNFLNENWEYGSPLDTSGETGNVGNEPGNQPASSGSTGYGTTTSEQFSSLITLFSSFSGFIGSLFSFLPANIKILFTVVCTIIVGLMVKRAVL